MVAAVVVVGRVGLGGIEGWVVTIAAGSSGIA